MHFKRLVKISRIRKVIYNLFGGLKSTRATGADVAEQPLSNVKIINPVKFFISDVLCPKNQQVPFWTNRCHAN